MKKQTLITCTHLWMWGGKKGWLHIKWGGRWQNIMGKTKLINTTTTMDILNHGMHVDDAFQDHPKYYVDMPMTIASMDQGVATNPTNVFMNINKFTLDVKIETKNFEHLTQETLSTNKFLSLPHLLARKTHSRKPLVDYSQNHVVTSCQYLNIMQ